MDHYGWPLPLLSHDLLDLTDGTLTQKRFEATTHNNFRCLGNTLRTIFRHQKKSFGSEVKEVIALQCFRLSLKKEKKNKTRIDELEIVLKISSI